MSTSSLPAAWTDLQADAAALLAPVRHAERLRLDHSVSGRRSAGDVRAARELRDDAGVSTSVGDVVLREGDVLTPARLLHLAAVGIEHVDVWVAPEIAVRSAGDPQLAEGSAAEALGALLASSGARVLTCGELGADAAAWRTALEADVREGARLLVTCGGLEEQGPVRTLAETGDAELFVARLDLDPVGTAGVGTVTVDGVRTGWIALPDRPDAWAVAAELVLRPALGGAPRSRLRLPVRCDQPVEVPEGRARAVHGRLLPSGEVRLLPPAPRHASAVLALADALVLAKPGTGHIHDGDRVEVVLLGP